MRDGDIDYSKYTLLELEEALAGINKHQYPRNYANLRSAYEQLTTTLAETCPQASATEIYAAEREPLLGRKWEKFWDSRPVAGIGGAICIWWAYDLITQPDSCHPGKRLMGVIVNAICESLGYAAAASIPLVLGIISVAYAVFPKRRAGA